ncbi:MAG TPA: tetratricopeptide repeat protein [Oculatellaceae cyanobacterium]
MNRLSGQWPSHQTTTLTTPPTHQILLQMLRHAEKNVGQPFTVNWPVGERPLFCEILVIEQQIFARASRKDAHLGETQCKWTFGEYTKAEFGKQEKKPVWTHFTRDIGLITELLAEGVKAPESDPVSLAEKPATVLPTAEMPKRTGRFNALKLTKNTLPTQVSPSRKSGDVTLSGELNKVELTGILQSISICKMTGRLDLQDTLEGIEIFFEDGLPVHACQMKMLNTADEKPITGDPVLLSALIWNNGSFCFNPERKTSERSIKRKLEVLLLEGACLKDYNVYLQAAKIDANSVLHQNFGTLSDDEFSEKLSAGMPMDTKLQRTLYDSFDGKAKMGDILGRLNLLKPQWVPVLFNLLSCNLISTEGEEQGQKKTEDRERVIDPSLVTKAERELARYETGFLSFPLFMLFLQRELDRYVDSGVPLALVIFEIWHKNEAMSNEKLQKVANLFRSIAASYDAIGHYGDFEFAMLLPLKGESDSREFVELFHKFVSDSFDEASGAAETIKMTSGIATADGGDEQIDLQTFVTSAVKAKRANKAQGTSTTSVRQLRWEQMRKQAENETKGGNLEKATNLWGTLFKEASQLEFDKSYWGQAAEKYSQLLLAAGRFSEVEPILSQMLRYRTEQSGPDDISTITAAGELAHCYYAQGKYNDAEFLIQGVLSAYAKHFGEEYPVVATWYYNLATLYHVQHKHAAAEPMYKKSLEIRKRILGDDHAETKKSQSSYDALIKLMNPEKEKEKPVQLITGSWTVYQREHEEEPDLLS